MTEGDFQSCLYKNVGQQVPNMTIQEAWYKMLIFLKTTKGFAHEAVGLQQNLLLYQLK